MTDDISKVVREMRDSCNTVGCGGRHGYCDLHLWADRLESATTPAEVDAPEDGAYLIQYDDPSQSPELFVGHGAHDAAHHRYAQISDSWNAHLFAKIASNSRDCNVPNYATTLARQLAKSERDCAELRALLTAQNAAIARTDDLARQLAEAEAGLRAILDARRYRTDGGLADLVNRCRSMSQEDEAVIAAGAANVAEYKSLAEATRRLGEVEGLMGKWRGIAHEYRYNPAAMPRTAHHYEACADELEAALTKEPTK